MQFNPYQSPEEPVALRSAPAATRLLRGVQSIVALGVALGFAIQLPFGRWVESLPRALFTLTLMCICLLASVRLALAAVRGS
jgi:hypothetical protein